MVYTEESLEKESIKYITALITGAIKTAPKSKGINTIKTVTVTEKEKDQIAEEMKKNDRPAFQRDALNLLSSDAVILIGVKTQRIGLDCEMCRYKDCQESEEKKGLCIFNLVDLGIALGSAVSSASSFKVDNRIMYTVGYAARNLKFLPEEYDIIMGLPLKYSHKNIFFDRK